MLRRLVQRTRRDLLAPTNARLDTIDLRLNHLEVWLTGELEAIRTEFESRSRDQRLHTEAAVRACQVATTDAAYEHAESAAASAQTEAVRIARLHAESASEVAATAARDAAAVHANEVVDIATGSIRRELASVRSALVRRSTAAPQKPSSADVAAVATAQTPPSEVIDDLLYLALENRFRGEPAMIEERQERYVGYVKDVVDADRPVLDLGCGRGEWLRVLSRYAIPARGVDSNEACVDECVTDGLDVSIGDLVSTLRDLDDRSIGAITMFQVVEHLPFDVLANVIRECGRVLVPGGVLICETPNALNLRVAAVTFWLDPTHQHPLHPELLHFLATEGGFVEIEDVFANEIGVTPDLSSIGGDTDGWLQRFAESIEGPGDYALIARTPS